MTQGEVAIHRELQIAGILLILGLRTIIALIWKAPLALLVFAGIGSLLILAGIVVYLFLSTLQRQLPNRNRR